MATILQRASVMAVKEETTVGTIVVPSAGSDYIPLKTGFAMEFAVEELASDELLNDIGSSKALAGKEGVTGTHGAYLKHSEVEGQEPEMGILYESAFGNKTVNATEYDTVASSTTTVVNVDTGEGANFEVGQALLVKDATNGYSIRNVKSISTDALTLNFALENAPGTGVNLGKAILYKPAATDHPSYSVHLYNGNGGAYQLAAGCRTTALSISATAGQQAEVEVSYAGSKYYYNPILITSSTRFIDWTDDQGTAAASVEAKWYHNPKELARALETAINDQTTETITVTYSDSTGKFTIATATSSVLSLLWNTGTNTANTIGTKLGFSVAADDTGATSYAADNAQDLSAPHTPSYDDATNIVVKDAELFIGDQTDNICKCAQSVTIEIATPTTDVDCICEESGVSEKLILSREVTMTAEIVLSQYEVQLFDKLKQNESVSAMLNMGPKSGGNWVAGKCANIYLGNASVTAHNITGDDFVIASVSIKGYVTTSLKDCYLNFV